MAACLVIMQLQGCQVPAWLLCFHVQLPCHAVKHNPLLLSLLVLVSACIAAATAASAAVQSAGTGAGTGAGAQVWCTCDTMPHQVQRLQGGSSSSNCYIIALLSSFGTDTSIAHVQLLSDRPLFLLPCAAAACHSSKCFGKARCMMHLQTHVRHLHSSQTKQVRSIAKQVCSIAKQVCSIANSACPC
jgi:hypothetical protein